MDLNIHAEREKPFDFLVFKKQIELFLLRSEIISSNASSHFKDILLTFLKHELHVCLESGTISPYIS